MAGAEPRPLESGTVPDLQAEQIRLVFEQSWASMFGTMGNAIVVAAIFQDRIPSWQVNAWCMVCVLVALARIGLRQAYMQRRPNPAEARRWARFFIAGVAVNGLLWGFAGYFFFLPDSYVHQLLIAFVLGGMTSGSIGTLSPVRHVYPLFLVPVLIPLLIRLVEAGSDVHLAMAAMLCVYLSMMAVVSRNEYRAVEDSLRLRFENRALLDDLRKARDLQASANRELAAEVDARQRAQRALERSNAQLEQRVLERTARLAYSEDALREADRRKDEFLAMLGHELRNPLAPMRNAVEILKRPGLDEPRVGWCRDLIGRQVEHLARLVDDLLDIARISRGKIELRIEPLAVAEIVTRAVEASRPFIETRKHRLSVILPPEPLFVTGDLVRLDQVLSNLLHNAAKYTDEGGDLGLEAGLTRDEIRFRVWDTGRGIDAAAIPNLFELFYQADRTLDRSEGGLGIGLSLVKRLVTLHGGRVEAFSKGLGQGSEFSVYLPRLAKAPET